MAKRSKRSNDGPHIFWRNGRAYADLRTHAEVPRAQAAMELFETGTIIEQKLAESVPGTVY